MGRRAGACVVVLCAAVVVLGAQSGPKDDEQFQTAQRLLEVVGDYPAALEAFRAIESRPGVDRALRARALLGMAESYRLLEDAEASRLYQDVRDRFSDLREVAEAAAARLRSIQGSASAPGLPVTTQVELDDPIWSDQVFLTPDGRYLSARTATDIVIRDMVTGQSERLERGPAAVMVSPDGSRVAMVSFNETVAQYELRVQDRRAGARPRVVLPAHEDTPYMAAWGIDGKSILVTRFKQDYTWDIAWVSVADGTVRQVVSLGWQFVGDDRPSLSPDGKYIAYSALRDVQTRRRRKNERPRSPDSGDQSIYVLAAEGSGQRREVVRGASINMSPIWSPDGSHLLFLSDRSGTFELYSVAIANGAASGTPTPVRGVKIAGRITPIAMTPTGSLFYVRESPGTNVFQQELAADGSVRGRAVRVSENAVNHNLAPAYSPDGTRLAFIRRFPDGGALLVVHDLESGSETSFALGPEATLPPVRLDHRSAPVWRPDGGGILALATGRDSSGIVHLDTNTGQFSLLSDTVRRELNSIRPAISPDGGTIYIAERQRIFAVEFEGGRRREVWTAPTDWITNLALSPDGRALAITASDPANSTQAVRVSAVWHVNVDGSGSARLAAGTTLTRATWTRDGRALLYLDARERLMRTPVAGGVSEFTGLIGVRSFDLEPLSGTRVAFEQLAGPELWRIDNLPSVLKAAR